MAVRGDGESGGSGSLATYTWRSQAKAAEQCDNDAVSWTTYNQLAAQARGSNSGIIFVQHHYLSTVVFSLLTDKRGQATWANVQAAAAAW